MPNTHPTSGPALAGSDQQANLRGSIWMVCAMFGFALEDALVKVVATRLPVGEVLILFGLGGMLVFWLVAFTSGARLIVADAFSPMMLLRFCFEIVARLFYTLALALTPLSAATAIMQATPIVVVMGAAILFGEKVGWRRWSAILAGLAGVMIVLRPTADSFSALSILALIGMLGFAARDLATRVAPASLGTTVLGFYGYLSIAVAGTVYSLWDKKPFVMPDAAGSLALAGGVVCGAMAYALLMKAMRTGEISLVTPFRYTRLLFGLALGVFVFGETLDLPMIVGSGVIVSAGLFILLRGRARRA